MRDFYDVYLIYIKNWENINKAYYRKAVDKTFSKREYNGNLLETLDVIKNSKLLKKRWNIYQKKYEYSKNVDFDEVLSCIDTMINELYIVV